MWECYSSGLRLWRRQPSFSLHRIRIGLCSWLHAVWNVSHALHTPLMAVTNAISGIIIVGALLQIRQPTGNFFIDVLAFVAILVASINIFGGFRVTQRMLAMFRKG